MIMVSYWKSYLQKVVVLISLLFLTAICSGAEAEFRSLYVYGWGSGTFLNWTEVSTLVNIARTYNFNAIVPEIRKVGDAYYTSLYEPKANNPAVNDPDSAFDALSAMIQYAHDTSNGKAYIEVHAWMVADRIWKGSLSGAPSGHILLQHPEWAMLDYSGASSNSEGMYLDPGIPGAQDHQHKVWMDVVRRYDVDGIVLDYIRYPGYTWGYATTSLNRFNKLYSHTGKPSSTDDDFSQFRRDNITSMVKKLYAEVMEEKPSVKVSICAIPWGYTTTDFYNSSAYNDVFQDWKGMMEGHYLDYLSPMIYDPESPDYRAIRYRNWNLASKEWSGGRHVYVLQGSYMNNSTETLNQLYYSRETAGLEGLQIYRYGYATDAGGSEDLELYAYLTTEMFQSKVATPAMPWKTQSPYGIVKGTILYGTSSVDGAVVNLYSGDTLLDVTTTDATGFYAFMDVTPGSNINVKADGTRWGYASRYSGNYSLSSCQVVNVDVNLLNVHADFYGVTTTGLSPVTVKFIDTSTNYPTKWYWSFGDGTFSAEENPVHVYATSNLVKLFDVQLIVSNNYGADTILKPGYIKTYNVEKTALPDLKLFLGQAYPDAFNLEDYYSNATIASSSLLLNFLGQASLSGNTVSEGAYSQATSGTNYYRISGSWGEDTSSNRVKYSTYKITKLPIIGVKKNMAVDFPISEYAYDSAGKSIPDSFGHPDSLVISDTTAIQAQWAGDSIIQIQAGSEFTTERYIDIIASPSESSPFGMDMDKERLRVCPDLLMTGSFASDSELAQYGYETTEEFSTMASYSWVSSAVDKNNLAAQGCLEIQFDESTSGIKITPTSNNWVDYKAGQWYIARARIFSPDPDNKLQCLFYNFSNETREGSHVDLSAHIYFGVPAAWTWVDIPLYSNQTGKGFPQLILKSFNASTIYLDELQIINAIPDVATTLRKPGDLHYSYGKFNREDDYSGWGWEGYRTDTAVTTLPSLTVANGWLEADFTGAGEGSEMKGFKATATYGKETSIYTPDSQQGYGMAMKSLVNMDTTAFNSSEAVYIMIMMGVTQEGEFEILKEGTDIIASGEFGGITNGWHYLASGARSPYYQFQFSLKNNQAGKAQIGYVDLIKDTDGMDFGDDTLFP
jgi:uncharacterized lipoprotein YddW (UPF0748 family)/PKD repeat protein